MYKLVNQITALAIVPQVMSRQLTADDNGKGWIELDGYQLSEFDRLGGLFLTPG